MRKARVDSAGRHEDGADSNRCSLAVELSPCHDTPHNVTNSDGSPCPAAPECRRRWIALHGAEAAECGWCYQRLDRATLAHILARAP